MTRARKNQKRQKNRHKLQPADRPIPFIEHVRELRRRLMYIALSVGVFGVAAYGVEHHIVDLLLRPAHAQQFIYTSPGGGFDFLFRLCLYVGIIASIPVIIYQFLRYIESLIRQESVHFIAWGSFISGILAVMGVLYGYIWGLPAALHFLLNQFTSQQIQPLITIQSYLSFVMVYMVGSALLFQIPLVLIFINRIKPLKPGRLLKYERHVIVGSVVLAALMNATPNIFALFLLAAPIILMYQVGIFIIWRTNRTTKRPALVAKLRQQDAAAQIARAERAIRLQAAPAAAFEHSAASATIVSPAPIVQPVTTSQRRASINDIAVVRRTLGPPKLLGRQAQNPSTSRSLAPSKT